MSDKLEVILSSGRAIELVRANLCGAYDGLGLLDGAPTSAINTEAIEDTVKRAAEALGRPVYVIPPNESSPRTHPSCNDPTGREARFLPNIVVHALFESHAAVDPDATGFMHSWLTIVWYQDDWRLPPAKSLLRKIAAIDWDQYAQDEAPWWAEM